MITGEEIREQLRIVYDPELGVNIVDLGLVYDIQLDQDKVTVIMTLTTPGCPMHDTIKGGAERVLHNIPGIKEVDVQIVWEPQWSPAMMSQDAKEQLGYF